MPMEETKLAAAAREILRSSRGELCLAMPYLAEAVWALAPEPGDTVTATAATDGLSLYYNHAFLAAEYLRSGTEVNRLCLHMLLHCLFRHLAGRRGRDAALWDLACDTAAESVIDELPHRCLAGGEAPIRQRFYAECRRELRVLTAEGIYRLLLQKRLPPYEIARLQRAFARDDHGLWDAEGKEQQQRSERQDQRWQELAGRTRTAMDAARSDSGAGGEAVSELLRVAARDDVDYRRFLRRFAAPREILHSDEDAFDYVYYTYGLRRYGNMPLIEPPETREEKRIEDLVIAIDTSMSTSGALVREFLRCTYAILRSTDSFTRRLRIRILQCDDQLREDVPIESMEALRRYMEAVTLTGGSATDFRPVFEHVNALQAAGAFTNLRGLIYFTDGMGIYPEKRPGYDTAFVLLEEPPLAVKMPPWAIRLVLSQKALDRAAADADTWAEERLEEMPEL